MQQVTESQRVGSATSLLTAVTHDELVQLIETEIQRGYEKTEKQTGRRRLLAVVDELARSRSEGDDQLLTGAPWRIADIRIAGVGGIETLSPEELDLTPTAGLTIVRGPNGHGKTSLSRAMTCGLRGGRDTAQERTSGLWASDLLTDGLNSAVVELSLLRGSQRLSIRTDFATSGSPQVRATLTDAGDVRAVIVGDSWQEALSAASALFSYGALQNRLTDERDLQGYLEELLVLGPVWTQVREAVTAHSGDAAAAKRRVEESRRAAVKGEKDLVVRFEADDPTLLRPAPVSWPRASDHVEIDTWLRDTGVDVVEAPRPIRVTDDHENHIRALDTAMRTASASLSDADKALDTPGMAKVLHHVEQLVSNDDLGVNACPVCGTQTDWRTHARDLVEGLQGRRTAVQGVRTAISDLATWVESTLQPLLATDVPGGPEAEVAAFRSTAADGHHANSPAHREAQVLLASLTNDAYRQWLLRLRAASDATAEWRAALSIIVNKHAAVLREHGAAAAEADSWDKAQETLDELQVDLRQKRQDAVTDRMRVALSRMLPDADIELGAIRHQGKVKQQRGVEVTMTIGGRRAELGMLSDGQRNALLLTPLVILDTVGPFGFLVVDDPVHALDDVRVDLLAQELARLAQERQVIVLTHDPRLEEHLRSRRPDLTVVELHRDPQTRTVTWTRHSTPWGALLADARDIYANATQDGWEYAERLHSIVAGLCRDAVDGALRQAAITCAVQQGRAVDDALTVLGEGRETRRRIEHVIALAGGAGRLPDLERGRDGHLTFWNQGHHGQLPVDVDLIATITAAEEACAELDAYDWSAR
ncbi:MAG: AAA family ATPase [Kineosporiaceae bacterium]